ncbi:hypothetical protein CAPTEDRAFT_196064 [Capitella teleta]|uniref:FAM21/CAPZIP domain-containing protein n=1 Tax=Capitella teleta TaxID=283909 RepID=R7TTE8_CAPTE|nr:hypothetical protein CAPTEDRAFT_196064 [Capitella teleta]|eukprot:ELT97183.1 hypothetical protein CAPTEDRAFT_196064 [Capitella teleta]
MVPPIGPPTNEIGSGEESDARTMNGDADPSPGESSWERAWTLDEMRQGATDWSLASDAGMLQYLQGFSQRLVNQTHEIQKQMDGLLHEVKLTNVRVDSTFNDFIMLANTQFVENRVYDEDVTQDGEEKDSVKEKEKNKEEKEAELIPKINEALSLGLNVIESAFEKLDINDANSDSDDDDSPYKNDPILEPIDPYIGRSLPYIIGTQAFYQDDDVGLVDEPSDEAVSDHGSISQSESESEKESESESESEEESESESESESEQSKRPKHRTSNSKDLFANSADESEDEGDLFGMAKEKEDSFSESESEPDEKEVVQTQQRGPVDFASELASKIGVAPTPVVQEGGDIEQKKTPKAFDDNLFGPPDEADDDMFGSAFSKKDGLFSSGGGLFDNNSTQGNLLRMKPPRLLQLHQPKRNLSYRKRLTVDCLEVSFANDNDLFASRDEPPEDDFLSSNSSTQSKKAPPAKKISGLFDDDEEDLFATAAPVQKQPSTAKPQKKPAVFSESDLFRDSDKDEEDEGDLFTQPTRGTKPKPTEPTGKKLPPGAVSMFGGAANPLSAAIKARAPVEEDGESSDDDGGPLGQPPAPTKSPLDAGLLAKPRVVKEPSPAPSSSSLFAEEPEDLFKAEKKPKAAQPSRGLFDDEEPEDSGDIFSSAQKSTQSQKSAPKSKPSLLFSDEESDDLFAAQTTQQTTEKRKKPIGGVALFGGSDPFGSSPPEVTTPKKKDEAVRPKKKSISLFDDDDDLFGESTKVTQPSGRRRTKSKSLFEDEDLLFAGTSSKDSPDVDLFGSSSPPPSKESKDHLSVMSSKKPDSVKSHEKKPDLMGSSPDDDIFGDSTPAKTDAVKVSGVTTAESSSDKQVEEPKESPKAKKWKPPGGVPMFGGMLPPKRQASEEEEEKASSPDPVASSPEDDLFAPKPKSQSRPAFNPAAMMPGAMHPRLNKPDVEPRSEAGASAMPPSGAVESSISFDEPVKTSTLECVAKNRVRVQTSRRPPSRRTTARPATSSPTKPLDATDSSLPTEDPRVPPFTTNHSADEPMVAEQPPPISNWDDDDDDDEDIFGTKQVTIKKNPTKSKPVEDLFASPVRLEPPPVVLEDDPLISHIEKHKPANALFATKPKATILDDDDDIFASTKENAAKVRSPVDNNSDDDLFGPPAPSSQKIKKSPIDEDLFAEPVVQTKPAKVDLSDDEDIFATTVTKKPKAKKEDSTDDIFGEVTKSISKAKVFEDYDDDDDIFGATKASSKKAVTKDENLFNDDTDIFADIPAKKPKEKKAKKSGKSLFSDDVDDIFATDAVKPKATKSSSKKSKKTPAKFVDDIFADDPTNIFDDPLNALGN